MLHINMRWSCIYPFVQVIDTSFYNSPNFCHLTLSGHMNCLNMPKESFQFKLAFLIKNLISHCFESERPPCWLKSLCNCRVLQSQKKKKKYATINSIISKQFPMPYHYLHHYHHQQQQSLATSKLSMIILVCSHEHGRFTIHINDSAVVIKTLGWLYYFADKGWTQRALATCEWGTMSWTIQENVLLASMYRKVPSLLNNFEVKLYF